ncbi:cytochrome c oxidase assembly protein [Paenibacillus qinlingensis]|uniref:cytochrome c oxidase assembly protein n=1 Tax=Paenibacillus qinlingensis TaxID=1837343 RepID=UPI001566C0C6|nr:cytochrome c oxidase assembly protein [Paenibacillus qinlingensis]NQX58578.1 cytochrome c oxidase assembly protein [Paenibacillus qinlingensis]
MSNEHLSHGIDVNSDLLLILLGLSAIILYLYAAVNSSRTYSSWPVARALYWFLGTLCAVLSIAGPLAHLAHMNFTAHMLGHLLLGMLAPLFIVLAAPVTLILRSLPIRLSRRLARILKSLPFRIVSDPYVASLLNIGGLYILYTTDLYARMHYSSILFLFVHLHVFSAGYLFTISMIYIDKPPHRTSFVYRSIAFVSAMAAHEILSKYLYVNSPNDISAVQAANGVKLMYYGGDAINICILIIFFTHWFKAVHSRHALPPIKLELYNSKK